MKLGTPWAVWLLVIVPVLCGLAWRNGRVARERLRLLVADRLRGVLVGKGATQQRLWLVLSGLVLAIFALARPQWGVMTQERKGLGRDVIIAVDVSRSMLANDLPPSRLKRAKLAAEDLVHQLPGDRIGLVAFAGSAFLQAPVTSDHSAILTSIQELDPDLIPLPGTNISEAIRCAADAFDHSEGGQRALILMSDGEDLEADAIAVAKEFLGKIRIFTVGIGTPEGAVLSVPSPRGGMEYIRDDAGNIVQSHLDEGRLKELAAASGGFYTRLISGPAEMRHIVQEGIVYMEQHQVEQEGREVAVERYQWPLSLALVLMGIGLLLGEKSRRKVAVVALLLALNPTGGYAKAARELYQDGDYAGALEGFSAEYSKQPDSAERAYNLGAAAYKNKKWAEALNGFGQALISPDPVLRSKAEYNLANTLVQQARQGRKGIDTKALESAVAHYDEALARDPKMEDAVFNRDLVRKLLEKQKQEQQKQNPEDQKDSKDDKDKKNQEKKEKQDKSKDGQSGEDKQDSKSGEGQDDKDGKDGKDQNEQGQKGENGKQGKNGEKKQNGQGDQKTADNGDSPEPRPEEATETKPRGELKNEPVAGDGKQDAKNKERQAQAMQAGDGKLTKEQASALMEALRSEDRRVQLWTPNQQQLKEAKGREGRTW